jgi:tRNA threonylcarbamoyladenosine biosynthesis protein TsaE
MGGMIQRCTHSVAATKALAAVVADVVRPRDLILLEGELGAGKTAFVQGFAVALGVSDPVTSPTFTLAHEYDGRLQINHLDVYRLDRLSETVDLALAELLDGPGVTLIEWGAAVLAVLPPDYLEVRLTFGDDADDRRLQLRAVGTAWAGRWRSLTERTEAWAC